MTRRVALCCAAAMVLGVLTLQAQAKPNFAGKWTMVVDPNAPAPTAGRGGRGGGMMGFGQEFSAAQDDKTLTITTNNPQMGEMKSVYNLDGSETKNPLNFNGNSIERNSKAKWDEAKFVITTTTNFNGNAIESTQTLSLDASGNLVVESTSNFGGNGPTTTKATYKKAS